jgi:hypothetical protein
MRPISTRRALAAMAAAIGCLAAPASAALSPYQLAAQSINPTSSGVFGDYVSCPYDSMIVNGGSFTFPGAADSTALRSSTPTFQGNGWYIDGRAARGSALVAFLMCLPPSDLADTRLLTATYPSRGQGRSDCPPGTRVYGGGGFFHEESGPPDPFKGHGLVFASMPDGNGWFYGADHFGGLALTVSARCLPSDRFVVRQVSSVEATPTGSNGTATGVAECQGPFRVLMGGAWWHSYSNWTPRDEGYLSGSVGTTDQKGWRAAGHSYEPGARLTIIAFCIDLP